MDSKSLIGIALCILFYLVYDQYLREKYPEYGRAKNGEVQNQEGKLSEKASDEKNDTTKVEPRVEVSATGSALEASQTEEAVVSTLSADQLTIENSVVRYTFDQRNASLQSVVLKEFQQEKNSKKNVELISSNFEMRGYLVGHEMNRSAYNSERSGEVLSFWKDEIPWRIRQDYKFDSNGYGGEVEVTFENISSGIQTLEAGFLFADFVKPPEHKGGSSFLPDITRQFSSLVVGNSGDHDYEPLKEYCDDSEKTGALLEGSAETLDYVGFDDHYFLKIFQPEANKFNYRLYKDPSWRGGGLGCPVTVAATQTQGQIKPGEKTTLKFRTYFGPKIPDELSAVSERFAGALDLGWFGIIARPLLSAVKGFYKFLGNYGLAIILMTILLKILFYPLTRAAAVSMKNMQKFQPEMAAIREKFKDDRQKQQQEIMKFMSTHKINPAKGCLPILPQIPVFIAFYNVLSHSIDLRHAPFYGWIQDLSAADPYYITPVLLGFGMLAQQKLTPNPSMDKTQEKIMMMMPIMFTVMMLSLPAGMVIYMITNTIVSIGQQQWLNRKLGVVTKAAIKPTIVNKGV